jgi:RNA polymerase sigma-70 factor (ECF subfamily)
MDLPSSSAPERVAATAELAVVRPLGLDAARAPAGVPDDTALMLRYRDGDVRAFEILYERHKGPLYRYLQRLCRNRQTADDLFQEVWGKVIASRSRYEVRAQFNTFLFRIAHNCAIDHFRRSGRPQERFAQDVDDMAEELGAAEHERPESIASETQLRQDFRKALEQLPVEQRDVFVLYEESGLSLEEIGKITGVAMETAKSRLRYAVNKLRTALAQHRPQALEPGVSS